MTLIHPSLPKPVNPFGALQRSCQILCQVSSSTVLRHEAYLAEASSVQKAFLGMDEMMCGQRGRRELALFGGKMDQPRGIIEGLIQSPKSGQVNGQIDDWFSKEVFAPSYLSQLGIHLTEYNFDGSDSCVILQCFIG
ncbi:Protein-serine/threonine phosphatase [Forsythia ovata]|uniref:Protein-serine/threonine phosphatase n=1 Tax=Forsythia ovata TaxID=205694 RepID=A0ABD1X5X3_9LAMI